ncbi:hypothetical protein SAMN06309944_1476 [Micrococcales bacterium KH10]|nr:hypothetical protein SAMN06309944_1476 [Micrococcales bacterium KH10]
MNLKDLADHHLHQARDAAHGRSAELIVHDGPLRQSVLALSEGTELAEHNTPTAASLHVIQGTVEVRYESSVVTLNSGDLHTLLHERHAVVALVDSVALLTAVSAPS